MRAALFLPDLSCGGAEKIVLLLARCLLERRNAVELVLLRNTGELTRDLPAGVSVVSLERTRMAFAVLRLARYLKSRQPDVLMSTLVHANAAAVLARRIGSPGTRLVLRVESHMSHARTDVPRTWPLRTAYGLIPRLFPRADAIVAISEGVKQDLVETWGVPADRIVTVYNPVIHDRFHALAAAPPAHPWLRKKTGPVILGAGRLTLAKDFPTLIRSCARLHPSLDARLVILGNGPERRALEKLVADLGLQRRVDLPGFVENPYACIARADVFVSTSRFEGFGNVIAEALACGTPVVATDCPSGPAEILDRGRLGKLVGVGDVEAVADAVQRTLRGEREEPDPSWLRRFEIAGAAERYLTALTPPGSPTAP